MPMERRYKQRCRLSARQYTRGCPVVLAAGALLEDTQQPRLVAQLKWKSISPREIAEVRVRFSKGNFTYTDLRIGRGQTFGQYTAIPLDLNDQSSLRVTVEAVRFADGGEWVCPKDALWGVLPAFRPVPLGGYAEEKHADLWYCTCGGVNHEEEAACHRCGKPLGGATLSRPLPKAQIAPEAAQRAALAAQKAAEEQAARKAAAEKKAAEMKAAAEERAAALKAAAEEKAEARRQKQQEKAAAKAAAAPTGEQPAKKGKKWLVPAVCAVGGFMVAVLVMMLLPNGGVPAPSGESSGNTQISEEQEKPQASTNETVKPSSEREGDGVTAPGAGLDYTAVYFQEDGQGTILVDWEHVVQYFDCTAVCFSGIPYTTDNIDDYIKDSFTFASLVRDGVERGLSNDIARTTPSEEKDSTFCLLAFNDADGTIRLTGYFVGQIEHYKDDTWVMKLTHCDYNLTELYEQEQAAFNADKERLYATYISPENVGSSGAKYFLKGYNTGRSADPREDDCQMYHLWNELNSPYVDRYAREISRLSRINISAGRYVCCLLLDKNYEYIGYTMLSNE